MSMLSNGAKFKNDSADLTVEQSMELTKLCKWCTFFNSEATKMSKQCLQMLLFEIGRFKLQTSDNGERKDREEGEKERNEIGKEK